MKISQLPEHASRTMYIVWSMEMYVVDGKAWGRLSNLVGVQSKTSVSI